MTIRPLTLSDLPALAHLQPPWRLSLDWEFTQPLTMRLLAWRSLLPYQMSGACTLVHQEGGLLGQVQAEARPGRDKWTVLHAALAPQADPAILVPLLEALCVRAAAHGAGRVFAAAAEPDATALFRRLTFAAYADETVYAMTSEETREEVISRQPAPFAIRPQRSRDVWGVHSLYAAVTPRPIQLMEGLISDDWEPRLPGWLGWPGHPLEIRLVLEAEAGISGFLRLTRGRRGHRLELMVHPAHRDLAAPLLQAGLSVAADWPPLPLVCPVRGYQSELGSVLESAGFAAVGAQTLLAKEMTVRVRQRLRIFEPVMERTLEPARAGGRGLTRGGFSLAGSQRQQKPNEQANAPWAARRADG